MRASRIADRIRQELAEIILLESKDPRLVGLTITDVEVDRELTFAEVYVCTIEGVSRSQDVLMALDHAQGYLRSELARRIDLRVFPRLRFHWDPTFERAEKIERLFTELNKEKDQSADGVA